MLRHSTYTLTSQRFMQLDNPCSLLPATGSSRILLCTQLLAPSFPLYKDAALFNRGLVVSLF